MLGITLRRRFVWFDLETTSIMPEQARIKQISMRVFDDGKENSWKSLVNPSIPIPPASSAVTGITDEIIATGCAKCRLPADVHPVAGCDKWMAIPRFKDIAVNLHRGLVGADFGGYNVRYDLAVIKAEFTRMNLNFDYSEAKLIDPLRIWQSRERRRLEDAVERFCKRKMDGAHDADVDISETIAAFVGQLEEWPDLPRNVEDLHEICYPRDPNWIDSEGKFIFIDGVPCLNFGKAKGQPLKDNLGYLAWILRQGDFSVEVKGIAKNAIDGIFPEPAVRA